MVDSRGGGAEGYHFMYNVGGICMLLWSVTWHLLMVIDERCNQSNGAGLEHENKCSQSLVTSPVSVLRVDFDTLKNPLLADDEKHIEKNDFLREGEV